MLHDLDRTLETLLKSELPSELAKQLSISFATPDDKYPPQSVILPSVNFFLFSLEENRELRSGEPTIERRSDGSLVKHAAPVRVDCHYLVTAHIKEGVDSPDAVEHRILGTVMQVLLRHRRLPEAVLQGSLQAQGAPTRAFAIQTGERLSSVELWQSLKSRPRASLHYVLTIPVDVREPEEAGRAVVELRVGGAPL